MKPYFTAVLTIAAFVGGCGESSISLHCDACTYRPIGVWDSTTTGVELDRILGIAVDTKGRVYAPAGTGDEGVLVFNRNGQVVDAWGADITAKHGLRVFNDTVWVTERDRHVVLQYTLDGNLLQTLGEDGAAGTGDHQFNMPTDVAVAPNGDIYIADGYGNSRVMRFAPDGTFKQTWGTKGDGPGQFNTPHNIVIGRKGRVYVADRENSRVQIFDANGRFIEAWTHVGKPYGLAIDEKDNLYITDGLANTVRVTDAKGKVLTLFGATGKAPGHFQMAHSVAVDNQQNIYTAEGDGRRIQVFVPQ